ncbi:hypothetical protein DL96DRAFT_1593709 [Flagelloscypha sp. PMI_526]|nr:hypothetical protein DL96DRAFT_1593709 [Flagelloscypha sp. PMI_526]
MVSANAQITSYFSKAVNTSKPVPPKVKKALTTSEPRHDSKSVKADLASQSSGKTQEPKAMSTNSKKRSRHIFDDSSTETPLRKLARPKGQLPTPPATVPQKFVTHASSCTRKLTYKMRPPAPPRLSPVKPAPDSSLEQSFIPRDVPHPIEDTDFVPSSQPSELFVNSSPIRPVLHSPQREIVPCSQSQEFQIFPYSPQRSDPSPFRPLSTFEPPESVESSQMDELLISPIRSEATVFATRRSPQLTRYRGVDETPVKKPLLAQSLSPDPSTVQAISSTPQQHYRLRASPSPGRTTYQESAYDGDHSQSLASPVRRTRLQLQTPPTQQRSTLTQDSFSPHPTTSSSATAVDIFAEDSDEDLPDAVKEFQAMFTGMGSYPESFPDELKY